MSKGRGIRIVLVAVVAFAAALMSASAAVAAPPPNDDFANATVLGPALPAAASGTNAEATGEDGEPSHTGSSANPPSESSVWYQWTPSADVPEAVLDICDNHSTPPSIFVDVAVYTGTSVTTLGAPVVVGGGFSDGPGGCKITFAAQSGTTYRIAVDFHKDQGIANFTIRLRTPSPPANDNYAAATTVGPALPVSVASTTIDATTQTNEPAELGGSIGRSVWFRWTSGITGQVRADGCDWEPRSGDADREIGVYQDTNNTFPVASTVGVSSTCQIDFNAVAGQEYRIAFSGSVFGEGPFTFRIRSTAPPANDNFANPTTIGPGLPIAVTGTNEFATKQTGAGETGHGGGSGDRSVWFKWTPTAAEAGPVAINACGNLDSGFVPDLDVYTGGAVNNLSAVGTVPGGGSPYCYKLLEAVANTTYRITVSSGNGPGNEGQFTLDLHRPTPPANDAFETPAIIGPALPISVQGTTVDATAQGGEPTHASFNDPYESVWYSWTPAVSEVVTADTCMTTFHGALSVYTGAFGGLDRIAQSDDEACGPDTRGSKVTFSAVAGRAYLLAIDTLNPGYWGPFTLAITGPSAHASGGGGAPNPPPAFNLKAALKKCKKKHPKKKKKKCIKAAKKRAKG
jgi:hypothetical protein